MSKGVIFLLSLVILGGCTTNKDLVPRMVDGEEKMLHWPVVGRGVLHEIVVFDAEGNPSRLTQGISDITSDGAIVDGLSQLSGFGNLQGGLIFGALGAIADMVTASSRPSPPVLVVKQDNGQEINVRMLPDYLRITERLNCVRLGDRVIVVQKSQSMADLYPENWRWIRTSDFQPKCEELREQFPEG